MRFQSLRSSAPDASPEGLSCLAGIKLSPDRQQQLELVDLASGGSAGWRSRKRAEAWDLLALGQLAPAGRMKVEFLDLRTAMRTAVLLRVPVPCMPQTGGELFVAPRALLGITYRQEALSQPLPGLAFVQILSPLRVWHSNVAPDAVQPLCLGAQLPAGIRVKELVLMAYGALSMQSIMIDPDDPAGVLNRDAARWWQQHLSHVPLSRVPFLGDEDCQAVSDANSTGGSQP